MKDIDILELFEQFDTKHGGELGVEQFYELLHSLDEKITFYEAKHLFNILDASEDHSIQFEEFKEIFMDYDFVDLDDKFSILVNEIKNIIQNNKVDLKQIFDNYHNQT